MCRRLDLKRRVEITATPGRVKLSKLTRLRELEIKLQPIIDAGQMQNMYEPGGEYYCDGRSSKTAVWWRDLKLHYISTLLAELDGHAS